MRVAVLTISDSVSKGTRKDESGSAIASWATSKKYEIAAQAQCADETVEIVRHLIEWSDSGTTDLILTTGGTGLSPTDVTPEATRAVIDREAQGIVEFLRLAEYDAFPKAALSRAIAGVRNRTLIINLPGSPKAVAQNLRMFPAFLEHACDVLAGKVKSHDEGVSKK